MWKSPFSAREPWAWSGPSLRVTEDLGLALPPNPGLFCCGAGGFPTPHRRCAITQQAKNRHACHRHRPSSGPDPCWLHRRRARPRCFRCACRHADQGKQLHRPQSRRELGHLARPCRHRADCRDGGHFGQREQPDGQRFLRGGGHPHRGHHRQHPAFHRWRRQPRQRRLWHHPQRPDAGGSGRSNDFWRRQPGHRCEPGTGAHRERPGHHHCESHRQPQRRRIGPDLWRERQPHAHRREHRRIRHSTRTFHGARMAKRPASRVAGGCWCLPAVIINFSPHGF